MSFSIHLKAPSDDWDPQGYRRQDHEEEDLGAFGMHLAASPTDEENENDEEGAEKKPPVVLDEDEAALEGVDELKALDRLEKELKRTELEMDMETPEE